MRSLEAFNDSLICKWKWRFLEDKYALWRPLLEFCYDCLVKAFLRGSHSPVAKSSLWWRDIAPAVAIHPVSQWFLEGLSCCLGDAKGCVFGLIGGLVVSLWQLRFQSCLVMLPIQRSLYRSRVFFKGILGTGQFNFGLVSCQRLHNSNYKT